MHLAYFFYFFIRFFLLYESDSKNVFQVNNLLSVINAVAPSQVTHSSSLKFKAPHTFNRNLSYKKTCAVTFEALELVYRCQNELIKSLKITISD